MGGKLLLRDIFRSNYVKNEAINYIITVLLRMQLIQSFLPNFQAPWHIEF